MAKAPMTTAGASPRSSRPPLAFSTAGWPKPLAWSVELLSGVWFGIWLLVVLFVYSSLGSAGVIYPVRIDGALRLVHEMPRQWRPFEMTEFEWFHTPFFLVLCLLLAANITLVTVRKVPFNLVKLGVWLIHGGIVILIAGSLIYFGTKFEGDAPVIRCEILASVEGAEGHARLAPFPGDSATLTTPDGDWRFTVAQISPMMELGTTDADGREQTAYSAFVSIQGPDGTRIARRVVLNHPDRDEDIIEGRGLVRNLPGFNGARLADTRVKLSMRPVPQGHLWVKDSHAIYYRVKGESAWSMTPIKALPRYNDYLPEQNLVWPNSAAQKLRLDPISVPVSLGGGDASIIPGASFRVTGHLRYAVMQDRLVAGAASGPLNPTLNIALHDPSGQIVRRQLVARDPQRNSASMGLLRFEWVDGPAQLQAIREAAATLVDIEHPETGAQLRINAAGFGAETWHDLADTGWRCRVRSMLRGLMLSENQPPMSMAVVDFQAPGGQAFSRWVFDDPAQNLDVPADPPQGFNPLAGPRQVDARIRATLRSGGQWRTLIVAGPSPMGIVLLDRGQGNDVAETSVLPGQPLTLIDGSNLVIEELILFSGSESRPLIVPPSQRDADLDRTRAAAMILLEMSMPDGTVQRHWLPHNQYVADDDIYRRVRIAPERLLEITAPDGRVIEVCYGRQRRAMGSLVRLDDFKLRTHFGGYTGNTLEIRDWHSMVRFSAGNGDDASWSELHDISTNDPSHFKGLWFFQSYWDAPRAARAAGEMPSPGFAFTGLGVGNREGVWTMLFGSALSVAGICYAFYVKPIIKRRREQAVYARLAAQQAGGRVGLTDAQLAEHDPSLAEPNLVSDAATPGQSTPAEDA